MAVVCSSSLISIFSKCVVLSACHRRQKKICGPGSSYGMRFQFEFPFVKTCCLFQPTPCKENLNRIFYSSSGLHRNVLRFLNQYSSLRLNFPLADNRVVKTCEFGCENQIEKNLQLYFSKRFRRVWEV